MKFGKFEISEFVIGFILMTMIILGALYFGTKHDIEKEKTKQMQYQLERSIVDGGKNEQVNK